MRSGVGISRIFVATLLLCGVLTVSACASQSDGGDAIYNQIYKDGWSQNPATGATPFSQETADALL